MTDGQMTEEEIEALKKKTDTGTRAEEPGEVSDEFRENLDEALKLRMASGAQRSVGLWDGELAALIDTIDDNSDRMEKFATNARDALGIEEENDLDKSETVRLGVLFAIKKLDPELWDEWRDAVAEYHRGV